MQLCEIDHHIEALSGLVGALEVTSLSDELAAELVERFSRLERLAGAGKALCAKRVAETGHFGLEGARDAASWLARVSGDSKSAAGDALETASRLERLPKLADAFKGGELSGKQAHEVARAGFLDPSAEDELLRAARSETLGGLRDKADKVAAAARSKEDDEERYRRIHAGRHLRTHRSREGAFEGRFSLTPDAGARLMGPLEALAGEIFEQAWRQGRREPREAYLADALVALATGEGGEGEPDGAAAPGAEPAEAPLAPTGRRRCHRADSTVIMRIDLEALVRGRLDKGEECSIDGIGHVPVSVVQSYLDKARVRLVVTNGVAIDSIFSFKRNIGVALDTALHHRDRSCVVPGCSATFGLERDHVQEFARNGPTTLSNLVLLCPHHHRLKSAKGYRIEGEPGRWRWLRPDGSPAGP